MIESETLLLAALAGGHGHLNAGTEEGAYDDLKWWKPTEDESQAMALVKHLKLTVAPEPSRGGWSVGGVIEGEFKWLAYNDDLNQAIVLAAAKVGLTL